PVGRLRYRQYAADDEPEVARRRARDKAGLGVGRELADDGLRVLAVQRQLAPQRGAQLPGRRPPPDVALRRGRGVLRPQPGGQLEQRVHASTLSGARSVLEERVAVGAAL